MLVGQVGAFTREVYVKLEIQKIKVDGQNEPNTDVWDPGFLSCKVLIRINERH